MPNASMRIERIDRGEDQRNWSSWLEDLAGHVARGTPLKAEAGQSWVDQVVGPSQQTAEQQEAHPKIDEPAQETAPAAHETPHDTPQHTGGCVGGDVILKRRVNTGLKERLKRWLQVTRGHRQWRGAAWLLAHGFASARPLVLACGTDADGAQIEVLALTALPGKTVLEHLAHRDLGPREEQAVARGVGALAARLTGAGRINRDCKASNLVVAPQIQDARGATASIALIDTVAISRALPGHRHVARMLAQVGIESLGIGVHIRKTLIARAVREAQRASLKRGSGFPAPPTEPGSGPGSGETGASRVALRAERRWLWRRIERIIGDHGDPTPRVNPLARPTTHPSTPAADTPAADTPAPAGSSAPANLASNPSKRTPPHHAAQAAH